MDKFLLGEVYLQQAQQDGISAVANAQLAAKQAGFLAEKASNEAKANIAQAEGLKQVKILQAQADAEAIRIVNEQLSQSPKYIEYIYAKSWNGAYPSTVLLSDGSRIPVLAGLQLQSATPTPEAGPSPTPAAGH